MKLDCLGKVLHRLLMLATLTGNDPKTMQGVEMQRPQPQNIFINCGCLLDQPSLMQSNGLLKSRLHLSVPQVSSV
jgi:hypothetical protein